MELKELSIPCRIGIIGGWIAIILFGISFFLGLLGR